tara:strand:+ start:380 stop:865 length:486 start_codon:yes stop_codon:yes gene_type:complete
MATIMYSRALKDMLGGTLTLPTDTGLKIMLLTSTYIPDPDDTVVDSGGSSDPLDAEINVGGTGYVGGHGGSGRKFMNADIFEDKSTNRVNIGFKSGVSWTGLAAGVTISAAALIKETGANDTNSKLIAYFDVNDFATNGGTFSLLFNSASGAGAGHFRFPV